MPRQLRELSQRRKPPAAALMAPPRLMSLTNTASCTRSAFSARPASISMRVSRSKRCRVTRRQSVRKSERLLLPTSTKLRSAILYTSRVCSCLQI
ncbi:hypothetical protein sch_09340 [Serratia plymuthica]|nr:hypothetical protein sch_09340 [Serratia plymuthica]